jgi:arabinogalactan endo-1,4-beta-galactosidase
MDIDELEDAVYAYVNDAVTKLIEAGARPDMVQVGNEVTSGMLWEVGRIEDNDFTNFGRLLKAGISAVHDADDEIRVMLHIEKCNNLATTRWWLDGVLAQGVSFDVLGQSCYAAAKNSDGTIRVDGYQGTPAQWKATFDALASEYPELEFVIAEYSAEQRAANDVMFGLPNGRGLGTFNWDPTRFYETHPNVPLFATDGAWNHYVTIPEQMGLYDQMAADYGLK